MKGLAIKPTGATDEEVKQARRPVWPNDEVLDYLQTHDKCKIEMKADRYSLKCASQSLRAAGQKRSMELSIYRTKYGLLVVRNS